MLEGVLSCYLYLLEYGLEVQVDRAPYVYQDASHLIVCY